MKYRFYRNSDDTLWSIDKFDTRYIWSVTDGWTDYKSWEWIYETDTVFAIDLFTGREYNNKGYIYSRGCVFGAADIVKSRKYFSQLDDVSSYRLCFKNNRYTLLKEDGEEFIQANFGIFRQNGEIAVWDPKVTPPENT